MDKFLLYLKIFNKLLKTKNISYTKYLKQPIFLTFKTRNIFFIKGNSN